MEPFCYWHIGSEENPDGTACSAHLYPFGRSFSCPYRPYNIRYGQKFGTKRELYISRAVDNGSEVVCPDFRPEFRKLLSGLIRKVVKKHPFL